MRSPPGGGGGGGGGGGRVGAAARGRSVALRRRCALRPRASGCLGRGLWVSVGVAFLRPGTPIGSGVCVCQCGPRACGPREGWVVCMVRADVNVCVFGEGSRFPPRCVCVGVLACLQLHMSGSRCVSTQSTEGVCVQLWLLRLGRGQRRERVAHPPGWPGCRSSHQTDTGLGAALKQVSSLSEPNFLSVNVTSLLNCYEA